MADTSVSGGDKSRSGRLRHWGGRSSRV